MWIAKGNTRAVVPYGIVDPVRKGNVLTVPQGEPVAIAAAKGAVWVGSRDRQNPLGPGYLFKFDPDSGALLATIGLPRGLQNLAVGEGGVWVIDGRRDEITRYGIATASRRRPIRTGAGAYAVAVGDEICLGQQRDAEHRVAHQPAHAARRRRSRSAPGRRASSSAATPSGSPTASTARSRGSTRGSARSSAGRSASARRPFAVRCVASTAWVTLLDDNSVARVRFARHHERCVGSGLRHDSALPPSYEGTPALRA